MGRYFYTANSDFDGKFWFGVQDSTDPGTVYRMVGYQSCDEEIEYQADEKDSERILRDLDKQYTKLGVEPKKRRYVFDNGNDISEFVWGDLEDYFLQDECKKHPDSTESIPYDVGDGETKYPVSSERLLAAARVSLGLRILNDIRKHGECMLTAEVY